MFAQKKLHVNLHPNLPSSHAQPLPADTLRFELLQRRHPEAGACSQKKSFKSICTVYPNLSCCHMLRRRCLSTLLLTNKTRLIVSGEAASAALSAISPGSCSSSSTFSTNWTAFKDVVSSFILRPSCPVFCFEEFCKCPFCGPRVVVT